MANEIISRVRNELKNDEIIISGVRDILTQNMISVSAKINNVVHTICFHITEDLRLWFEDKQTGMEFHIKNADQTILALGAGVESFSLILTNGKYITLTEVKKK